MKFIKTYNNLNERNNYDEVEIYYQGNINRDFFVYLVKNGESIGGQYSGLPSSGELQFASMKVAIIEKYRGKNYGYGSLLYLVTLSLLGKIGLSPHRREGSSRIDSQNVWIRLNDKDYIERIPLEIKLYDDNDILDSKYILTDNNMKTILLNKVTKTSNDAFDKSIKIANDAWEIVDDEMSKQE
jgi:hypothetical protein